MRFRRKPTPQPPGPTAEGTAGPDVNELAARCLATALINDYPGATQLHAELIRAGVRLPLTKRPTAVTA